MPMFPGAAPRPNMLGVGRDAFAILGTFTDTLPDGIRVGRIPAPRGAGRRG